MEILHTIIAGITAVILFVFGLENFSREIESISGERFRKFLGEATRLPVVGLIIGAMVTALIQSSSATSVITISLVNAGVLSFKSSMGIIFGTNVGTTVTAQLVAFKLTAYAPVIIIAGFALSMMRSRWSIFGKSVFYFGFVFFSLNLISAALTPLQENETVIGLLTEPQPILLAILFGAGFTALVQSSSVTTGLAIIFTQQGILGLENAIPLIMGANIGTTVTALIAVLNMDVAAKKTALCHMFFNVGGVILFLPLVVLFGDQISQLDADPALVLANVHLIFNVVTSLVFLILINQMSKLIDRILGEGEMDFERIPLPVYEAERSFEEMTQNLNQDLRQLLKFLQQNYNAVTLSMETNYPGILEAASKRLEYFSFVKKDYLSFFARLAANVEDEQQSADLILVVNRFDYLFQVHDSIVDLFETKRVMDQQYLEPQSDVLIMVRKLAADTLEYFEEIQRELDDPAGDADNEVKNAGKTLQSELNDVHRELLRLLAVPTRKDAGALTNFVTYSQRLKDKLENYYRSYGHQ
jgi:phosphate:Na+ symporter